MENLTSARKRYVYQNQKDRVSDRLGIRQKGDQINCFSLDLQKLRKKQRILPQISTSRNNIVERIAKIKQQSLLDQISQRQVAANESPSVIPFQMNYSMPFQLPFQYPCHYPYGCLEHQCHNCCNKKPKKRRRNKKPKKQPKPIKPKLKNWFRIAGYAVYFSIFIRHYSQKFTINRRQWFLDRYDKKNKKGIINLGVQKFQQKVMQLDLYEICSQTKQNKQANGQTVVDWQDYTNTALIPKGKIQNKLKGRYTVGQFIINFTQTFLQKVEQITFEQQFLAQFHEVFSAGTMDMNFMIDNLYVPEQTPFLFIHPTKGYIRLGYQQEIQLLLMKLMVRMIIYNFLFSLHKLNSWNKKLQDKYMFESSQRQEVWQLGRILGVYLYMNCKQIYFQGIKNLKHNSNFYELAKKYGIKSAKPMQQQKVVLLEQAQGQKQFQLIKNIKDYEIIKQKINKNSKLMQYRQILKDKIISILGNLHSELKKYQRQLFQYIKNMTIIEKYIIFDGIKRMKQQKNKKQKNFLLMKPNQARNTHIYAKQWDKIYGNNSSSLQNGTRTKENVKFQSSIMRQEQSSLKDDRNSIKSTNRQSSSLNKQNKPMMSSQILKSTSMKKPFNFDTINSKYDRNRQDRIQQRFRNFLFHQPAQQNLKPVQTNR